MHELERRHHDMGGAVAVWALESQHDIAGAVKFEPFVGDGRTGDVAAQLLEFVALIHGAAHLGMEAESLRVSTTLGMLRIKARDRLRAQHFLARPGSEGDAIGADGRKKLIEVGLNPYLDHGKQVVLTSIIDLSEKR